ncbi:low affinity iron permease family protein [Solilutibacter silvestris]|uniref:low affinity iron permease family protein n=1 Tax=Solilutibacter silvestris TaxID=1645665 RepID=UPI003D34406B
MAYKTARLTGRAPAFLLAFLLIVAWLVTGPIFHFSDTWQLIINTGTTIVTFLMVFLIQNSQNRDTDAIQMKLDELILVTKKARNSLLDLEELDEAEIERVRDHFIEIAKKENRKNSDEGAIDDQQEQEHDLPVV